ncbi:MAG TPA: adenosylcobinamide-GDP ribazoletransferase [Methanospirillum sp.]|uniref:adenosylcobinamide-GDP ribazoletransferase n=1 Tax=Methanospirillum sp. TaxID=45200 RepID=UPI002BDB136B|nr:adenosylcobinamide-GDP ribazoletransferase [Methanospirillum sp.]HOJ96707.1 adenosylcobinamide-GDP ribazoletransferase [Methanospirillum sp.]HPP77018.1 adenosylcobinamide-GDP ribazoletransferase [Methanospirillum sp.]
MIEPVRALLQFTTVLPLGKIVPFEAFARNTWLYPLAGYITGGIGALVILLLPAPSFVQAVLATGAVLLVSGANHLDGLLDFGDGLMAHGSREKRIRALTDRQMGTGALALGMMVTLLTVASLSSFHQALTAASALIFAEAGGKWSMAILTAYGRPFHEGLHAVLHEQSRKWFVVPATLLLIPAFLLPLPGVAKAGAAIVLVVVPLCMQALAYRLFGGVNGDVTGATGEINRCALLTALAIILV